MPLPGSATCEGLDAAQADAVRRGRAVSLRGLRKEYAIGCGLCCCSRPARRHTKVAVEGLDADFLYDTITCLLGHNGAGKTTAFSMVCGLAPPTAGRLYWQGRDVTMARQDFSASGDLGMCPQHDGEDMGPLFGLCVHRAARATPLHAW